MKAIFACALAALLGVWWYASSEDEPERQVVAPSRTELPASSALSLLNYGPRTDPVQGETQLPALSRPALSGSSPAVAAVSPTDQERRGYKQSKTYKAFYFRKGEILSKFEREFNDSRIKQGLEPLPHPKVEPTPEERAAMIYEFQAGIRDIDAATTRQGYPSNIEVLLVDLLDTGIAPTDLGMETFQAAVRLAQAQADHQAKYIQTLLDRGCFGTAGYIMGMYIHSIARGLGNTTNMGYEWLEAQIDAASAHERNLFRQAKGDEALRESVRIQAIQRAKVLGCRYG